MANGERATRTGPPLPKLSAGMAGVLTKDFLLLWSGQTISTVGTQVSGLALPLLALALSHSPAQAGAIAALRLVPYLALSLPAGALLDRWNRKRAMLVADGIRSLALGSVPLTFALGRLGVAQLYLVALVEGTAFVFFTIAQVASLPRVISRASLPHATALNATADSIATLIGPGLAGFIISLASTLAVGATLGFLVDSLSYLVSVCSLGFMRLPFQGARSTLQGASLRHEIGAGLQFLWRQPSLRTLALLGFTIGLLVMPSDLAILALARDTLHSGASTIGLIFSAGGLGGIVGALVAPWVRAHYHVGQVVIGTLVGEALATTVMALAQDPLVLGIGSALVVLLLPIYSVTQLSYRLARVPDAVQARVNSLYRLLPLIGQPLGMIFVGLLLSPLGPRLVLGLIAAGFVLSALTTSLTDLHRV